MATTSHFFTFSHLLHHKSTFFTFSARAPSNKLIKHPFISLPSLHATQKTTFVSTEYHLSPAPAEFDTNRLRNLCNSLTTAKTLADKVRVVDCDSRVKRFFKAGFHEFKLDEYQFYLLKCIVAAGQEHVLNSGYEVDGNAEVLSSLNSLLQTLRDVDEFYNCIGGIVG
ncbi:UTP--glucose-1-phosphate uridylyltransferase 3, chloroplastic, partial [Tanacetum coccineum]